MGSHPERTPEGGGIVPVKPDDGSIERKAGDEKDQDAGGIREDSAELAPSSEIAYSGDRGSYVPDTQAGGTDNVGGASSEGNGGGGIESTKTVRKGLLRRFLLAILPRYRR